MRVIGYYILVSRAFLVKQKRENTKCNIQVFKNIYKSSGKTSL